MTDLARTIEALLFHLAEPIRIAELSRITKAGRMDVDAALAELRNTLEGRGVRLLEHADEVSLVTAPDAAPIIESVVKEELSKDLSRASLETLSIILYHGPLTRAEIDHIRGVNSTFILRNLMIRGLVEKLDNPRDQRSFLYRAASDTLRYLGVSRVEDLPEYLATKERIAAILAMKEGESASEPPAVSDPSVTPDTPAQERKEESAGVIPEPDEFDASIEDEDRAEDRELGSDNYESSDNRHAA